MTSALFVVGARYFATAAGLPGVRMPARIVLMVAGLSSIGIAVSPEPARGSTPQHLAWTSLGAVAITIWPAFTARRSPSQPLILTSRGAGAVTAVFLCSGEYWAAPDDRETATAARQPSPENGRVFVANMTGNIVFAGFAIVGALGFSLAATLFALAGFLAGAAGGGAMTTRVGHDRATHPRAATLTELALIAAALAIAAASGDPAAGHGTLGPARAADGTGAAFNAGITDALAFLLAIAMGIQNSMARKLAIPDLTTTVLTMTLTGIGTDPRTGQRAPATLTRRLLVVATMLAGGVLGAWLVLAISTVSALALAAGLLAITAVSAARTARRPAPWRDHTPENLHPHPRNHPPANLTTTIRSE